MAVLDETFEEEQSRERLEQFYGQYSADVRKTLLSKNIKKPENLYDVLYTPIRRELLSKNIPTHINIEESSTQIRNGLLAKQIEKDINLDKSGENIRKSLLAKNDLIQSSLDMEGIAESSRKSLISKNVSNNKANPDSGSDSIRSGLESKNAPKKNDLEGDSSVIRNQLLSKNDSNQENIDQASLSQRQNLLSKNASNGANPDNGANTVRKDLLSQNSSNGASPDNGASTIRKDLLSSNVNNGASPDNGADGIRKDLLSSNVNNGASPDNGADIVRRNLLSNNKHSDASPENVANTVRQDLLSSNVSNGSSPDNGAHTVRKDLLSQNSSNGASPDNVADGIRKDLLSNNINKNTSLDNNADIVRKNLLSNNKPNGANPEKGADSTRKDILANNVANGANPENGASIIRNKLASNNKPNGANPETGSIGVRNDLLASNVSNGANPEIGANDTRDNLASKNIPNGANPEIGANDTRDDLLSKNVANGANPEIGANDTRDNLASKNAPSGANPEDGADAIRDNLLAKNISNGANPETGADTIKNNLLSKNHHKNSGIDTVANKVRNALLSSNVSNTTNADALASSARNDNLSKNASKGTVGNSQLDNYSNPFRHILLSKNHGDTPLGANIIIPNGTSQFIGISNLDVLGEIVRDSNKLINLIFRDNTAKRLQQFYGTDVQPDKFTPFASITNAAQLHNIENNTFALHRYSQGSSAGIDALSQFNNSGFQDLIHKTIGSFQKYTQIQTNSTPAGVIQANKGQYLQRGPEEMLRPDVGPLGSPSSMVIQTEPSDTIENNFNRDIRGIKYIMNTIKNSNIALANNYDPQNNKSFIIGTGSNGYKRAFGRYTVANPYAAPKETGVLELRLTNYAITGSAVRTMSFPPYIKSFQHSDNASWNETLFLGRPEAIYTYSNSKRSGTLEFMVLTDYAQSVDIGVDFENGTTITETFDRHFTDGVDKPSRRSEIQAKLRKENDKLNELSLKRSQLSGTDTSGKANLDKQISDQQSAINALQKVLDSIDQAPDAGPERLFAEGTKDGGNIYQSIIDGGRPETDPFDGTKTSHPADTITKLNAMKSKLLFQPAFFSGDKVDFLRRMEFIAKLTRPSRNQGGNGFSFTTPPVCHLHLGDWINNDIIIESVNYDYSDSPWTFDGNRTQPMWANVTISFNIVGAFGAVTTENVPLATDNGGFFQRKVSL